MGKREVEEGLLTSEATTSPDWVGKRPNVGVTFDVTPSGRRWGRLGVGQLGCRPAGVLQLLRVGQLGGFAFIFTCQMSLCLHF